MRIIYQMYDSKDIENSIYLDQFNGVNSARDNWVNKFFECTLVMQNYL